MKFENSKEINKDEPQFEERIGSEGVREVNKAQAESRFYSLATKSHELLDELKKLQENSEGELLIEEKRAEVSKVLDEVHEVSQRLNKMYKEDE